MKKTKLLLPLLVLSLGACEPSTQKQEEPEDVRIIGYEKKDDDYHTVKRSDGTSSKESHNWDNGEITLEATETTEGVKTYNCKLCDAQKTEKIPSTGISHTHSWSENWSKDTNYHWKACSDSTCNEVNEKAAHTWNSGVVTTAATATTDGVKTYTCTVCQQTKTEIIPATGGGQQVHTHAWATPWTTDDNYHWKKCTDTTCNEINSKAAHTWNSGTITTPATATTDGVKTYACTVCQKTKTEKIPATGGGQQTGGTFTFNDQNLQTAQKIHTTNQENFLNYSKEYYNITGSELDTFGAGGNAENSFPNKVNVTWNYTAPSGKTVKTYDVITGQKSDLSDGYKLTGTSSKELSFYNAFLGDNYFKVIANFTDGTTDVSEIKTFKVDATAPRNLKVGTMSNCRDMGGRTNGNGGTIKQGLIYRTSDPATSGVGDVSEWTKRMHIKTEIYVKDGSNSSGPLGSSVKFVNASMDYGATPYSNMARNAERLRKVFSILGDSNNYPLMYHCRIGTDRTGICGVAINGLLGVSFNETIQDYAFSNFGKIDGQRYAHKASDPNGDDIAKYVDEILAMPGATFQEKTICSLLSIGIPAQTLQNVIDIMTEGNKITIPSNITVFKGNDLTNNGGTKKTDSDYKAPDTYYEISGSSQSISCNYTLTEAKKVTVVCYLGCTDSSSSKKLADGITLKINGTAKTISNTKTYQLAGFGTTGQSRRTGYMFNILGEFDLSSGSHTITISGKNSDKFNIGAVSVIGGVGNISVTSQDIDVEIKGDSGSNTGTGTGTETGGGTVETGETVIASFLATSETSKSGTSSYSNNQGTYYKTTTNNGYIEYKFDSTVAGQVTLKALVGTKAGNATSSNALWFDGSSAKIKLEVNGTNIAITDSKTTFADAGMTTSSAGGSEGDSNVPVWVSFPTITVVKGQNTFRITRTGGYSLYFYEFKVVC